MEHIDPHETRRRGTRRVRLVTAGVAGAALVGTGVLTVVAAEDHPAAAVETAAGTSAGTTDDGDRPGPPGGLGPDGSSAGGPHASSGGS